MKRNLPVNRSKRAFNSTDTITLLMQLGFKSTGPGHWSNGAGIEIREVPGDEPYRLERPGIVWHYPSLIAVYQELIRPGEAAR